MAQYGFQRSRITIIPNGIDTTDFKPATPQEKAMARAKLSLGPATFVAFYAGRLGPGKGVEYLIKAWKTNNTPGSVLYILGKGPGEYEYRNLSAGDNTIRFEGWKDNIRPYLLAADVFVLPSFAEGQPNSLIEAMACGLACIGADIGGINDMITNKVNGLLVAPGNISSLANALSFVLGNSGLRQQIGKAAREHVISHLSIEMIADKYREMYSNLTKGNSN
jgi:glycosyltransferase involved in cell wall biosynthesis